jgi:hypothetical protein
MQWGRGGADLRLLRTTSSYVDAQQAAVVVCIWFVKSNLGTMDVLITLLSLVSGQILCGYPSKN